MIIEDKCTFENKAQKYWTDIKNNQLCHKKKYPITPQNAPYLLRIIGLLNADCSISHDNVKKFMQINHFVLQIEPYILTLIKQFKIINILDTGCGNSYSTFLLAWCFKYRWQHNCRIIGIDNKEELIEKVKVKAHNLELDNILKFHATSIAETKWSNLISRHFPDISDDVINNIHKYRPHLLMALHACDTATDDALSLAIKERVDFIAVAPCCQAELSKKWETNKNTDCLMKNFFEYPQLRRELATHVTDLMRCLLLKSCGYEINVTEFVSSEHSHKNRLITGLKRGKYLITAKEEYEQLKKSFNNIGINLENTISEYYQNLNQEEYPNLK